MKPTPGYASEGVSQWSQLIPARTDRAVLVGQTGSGKTTLARYLLNARKYKVVADYKGRIDWPEYRLYTSLKKLVKAKEPALLYRPSYAESRDEDAISRFWEWIYRRGGTTAYADEITAFTNRDTYPFHYGACLVRGREMGIEVWSATQRPTGSPQVMFSESEHFYSFKLKLPQDRERVESFTGIPRRSILELPKQNFLYARQDSGVQGPFKLQLSNNQ